MLLSASWPHIIMKGNFLIQDSTKFLVQLKVTSIGEVPPVGCAADKPGIW